ncbi:probable NADPH:quinone oxidoreductase 2 [Lolium perenne]|uniref:probable NADPH:quinone oxidoreductase 2 n=1 Tax=Lolium perenne TaxID=4522 RepID=UPI0021E9E590|nr:probable NADPH:quinone oxidoreductase 2 [Lolium perenne]
MEGSTTAAAPAKRAKRTLRVAAISGSLRRASANTGLIRAAAKLCEESIPGLQIDHVDISGLPLVNTDLENAGGSVFPAAVEAFRDRVRGADCFLFASPEYNYSISGPLKNALDWGSRPPNVWADRAAAVVSASGKSGGKRMVYHVRQVGVFLDIHFVNKPEGFVQANHPTSKFDGDGNLIDPETEEQLRRILLSLQAFALRLIHGKTAAESEQGN